MPKDHPKMETFDPKACRLGVQTPEYIYEALEDIRSALGECQPYQSVAQEDNLYFLEVAKREAAKIIQYVEAIEIIYALHEHPTLDERKEV